MADHPTAPETVTRLLEEARSGNRHALDALLPLIYAELHQIAERHMSGEREDHTLQPTALVNEAVLRLISGQTLTYADRTHFLRAASRAMRHVLVDHANARNTAKRSAGVRVTLDEQLVSAPASGVDILVLDDALTRLAAADARCAQVVELRFFGGLSVEETAVALETSPATVKRDWQFARRWLAVELKGALDFAN
ncbi:MAG: sigma-70 family RNA polymerase sigma factor [Gemmatimonas sp.]